MGLPAAGAGMKNQLRDLAVGLLAAAGIFVVVWPWDRPPTEAQAEPVLAPGRCCGECLQRQAEDQESLDVSMRSQPEGQCGR